MDLVRELLLYLEEHEGESEARLGYEIAERIHGEYNRDQVEAHLWKMVDGGLLTGKKANAPNTYKEFKITWKGDEFLAAAKDDGNWEKTKNAAKAAGNFTLPFLLQLLIDQGTNKG